MNALNPNYRFGFVRGNSGGNRAYAISAMWRLYDNNATVAYIGEYTSENTIPLVYAESRIRAWHCSGSASSSDLSSTQFPRFFRTIPDNTQQGAAMAKFVLAMGWTHVNLLAATDSYGASIAASFLDAAQTLGITVFTDVYVPGDKDLGPQVRNLANSYSNVHIVAAYAEDFAVLLREARAQGLLNADNAWVGTDALEMYMAGAIPTTSSNYVTDMANANGVLYMAPYVDTNSTAYQTMSTAYSAINTTYPISKVPYAALHYDCAVALARGLIQTAERVGPTNVTRADLVLERDFLPPPFAGATGEVSFSNAGDRAGSFSVWNMYGGQRYTAYRVHVDGSIQSVAAPQFFAGSSTPPPDIPARMVLYPQWSEPGVIITSVVRAILIVLFLAGTAVLFKHRNEAIVRNLSFPFLVLITNGCIWVLVGEFVSIGKPSRVTCHAPVWILTIGYQMIIGSSAVKTYRIWRIFDNKSMRRLKTIQNPYLFKMVASLIALQSIIFGIWLGAFPSSPVASNSKKLLYFTCASSSKVGEQAVMGTTLALNLALLVAVIYLGYKTRNVASSFRETLWIMYVAQNIAFAGVIILAFSFITMADFLLGAYMIRTVVMIYVVAFTYAALVGRVVIALLRGTAGAPEGAADPPAGAAAAARAKFAAGGVGTTSMTSTARAAVATAAAPNPAMHVSMNHETGKVAHVSGQYAVKESSAWFATWTMHAVHLFSGDAIIALVPDSQDTQGTHGVVLPLAGTQYDPNPGRAALCIELFAHGRAWLVQYESEPDRDAWVKVLAATCTVSSSSRSRSATGRPAEMSAVAPNKEAPAGKMGKGKSVEALARAGTAQTNASEAGLPGASVNASRVALQPTRPTRQF
ncbi:hypothetical protein AMAG_03936 [Allomyces macrogynus ATCC 38327]|uniref:G-protein coupled receptors family 3 profile domain-containing protein n=1 Tax=Allomyces macrogynus (strain ATCC 38327) TaxID=578462 RepID=A0A0L0S6W9_ALLM3|nr:hypothetical protein AMAG_03936 [Allomyces macrogynus ATCC 38327]|eukprot:KNE58353.1 hypothetical protein AMAG_03936 [Allomyces macrogynus ATCC 38327]